jgi:Spy/CpxP family protein refolding chaperone
MPLARILAGLALVSALALLGAGGLQSQDKEKSKGGSDKKAAAGAVPKYWDELGLTEAQRAEVVKLTREQRDKVDKLREEIRKLDEEYARKRVAVLSDDQRKKLIDLVAGEAPKDKDKVDPKAKAKDH